MGHDRRLRQVETKEYCVTNKNRNVYKKDYNNGSGEEPTENTSLENPLRDI